MHLSITAMPERSYSLAELAKHINASKPSLDIKINGIASLKDAKADQISFYVNAKQREFLATTKAAAVVLKQEDQHLCKQPTLLCENPYLAFAKLTHLFNSNAHSQTNTIHPSAIVASDVCIGQRVSIAANVVIGEACVLGDRVTIAPNCTIGNYCNIGNDSLIKEHVVLADRTRLGKRVIIQPSAVIGGDGFGFVPHGKDWVKIHHLGNVEIGDDVEIGANTAIDRATLDSTIIGNGVKIDNLVHISHNDVIGDRTVIAACVGIAGSTTVGKDCKIGGAAMINGQISICDDVTITPATRIHKSITKPGRYSSGLLPVEHSEWLRNSAYFKKLYKILDSLNKLDKGRGK